MNDKPNSGILLDLDSTMPRLDQRVLAERILASLSDGLMLIDENGRIVMANPAVSEILGVSMEQLSSRGWAELFFENADNADFNQVVISVLQEKTERSSRQVRYFRPDGQARDLAVTTIILGGGQGGTGLVSAVLVVLNDITEIVVLHRSESELLQRSQRLAQEKAEGLDRLARAVAHEIRNPITSIGGLAKRLLGGVNPYGREAQYLRRIMDSTERLETVVREVRDYADLPTPSLRPCDLGLWLAAQAENIDVEAQTARVELLTTGEVGKPGVIMARIDQRMLERVIDVLADNAVDAMPNGGRLTVGLRQSGDLALITIADTGRGIDPADLPYLFDPFYSTKAHAVGMSLAIAKRMSLDHHGDLTVESKPGQGATFTLQLPIYHPEQEGEPPEAME